LSRNPAGLRRSVLQGNARRSLFRLAIRPIIEFSQRLEREPRREIRLWLPLKREPMTRLGRESEAGLEWALYRDENTCQREQRP